MIGRFSNHMTILIVLIALALSECTRHVFTSGDVVLIGETFDGCSSNDDGKKSDCARRRRWDLRPVVLQLGEGNRWEGVPGDCQAEAWQCQAGIISPDSRVLAQSTSWFREAPLSSWVRESNWRKCGFSGGSLRSRQGSDNIGVILWISGHPINNCEMEYTRTFR
jgi:hypothetical protein